MANRAPRVVAELGRPETPSETASRKAESSRIYRSSQTFRNLIAALLVTLAVVAVVVLGVPRGDVAAPPDIDVAEVAAGLGEVYGRTVISPDVPDDWRVNAAKMEGDSVKAFTAVYVPDDTSFIRVSQAFDPDPSWASRTLSGEVPDGTVTIEGITWDEYRISDSARAGNISYALGTQAGTDQILIYGTADAETAATVAAGLTDQITTRAKETP
ncbi:DUF4245 family protein [Microbacterium caowuchunii]|uniref:DUF4245 family protein n=1 Tax=Microbacterium caowuchunii TaxID=2614638 RepID=A0A5N0T805_9MICO|nr:DUF4245 family protein [Microbacterium caowuchunii]KAA9130624.1 DUF4245 family protein [Microbacterium caowuchunii]